MWWKWKGTRMRSGAWRCHWIAAISSCSFKGWAEKVISWDGIHSWRRCCEDCRNNNNRLRTWHNFIDKAAAGFESIDANFERGSVGKCSQTALHTTERLWKAESVTAANDNVLSSEIAAATPAFSIHPWWVSGHPHQGETLRQQHGYDWLKAQVMVSSF